MKQYKALVLDMDGTIMDSLAAVEQATRMAGEKMGILIGEKELFLARYAANEVLIDSLGLKGHKGKKFARIMAESYRSLHDAVQLFPGIEKLLELSVPKGIVTSEERDEFTAHLQRLEIPQSDFAATVCAGDTPYLKPHPYPLLSCLEQMGIERQDAIYIGDSVYDMECAVAAGVDFGLALWGAGSAEKFQQAKYIFSSPEDVIAHV